MLTITVLGEENFDHEIQEFLYPNTFDIQLEHSLVSLSKWESKFEKPFLSPGEKTTEEALYYIYCMIKTPGASPEIVNLLSDENMQEINQYIDAKMTATWFAEDKGPKSTETITSELVYYWLSLFNIPFEAENWHLNRLFTLIKIHSLKNAKPKKMSTGEARRKQRELNEARRQQLGTNG